MKFRTITKLLGFCYLHVIISFSAHTQNSTTVVSLRSSFQVNAQKADFKDKKFPYEFKEHNTTTANYGFDILVGITSNKFHYSTGVGYFRNKFNFERPYNHALLNPGRDSLGIGTYTSSYTYHLFRVPLKIQFDFISHQNSRWSAGLENNINFSFLKVYNGVAPFPGADNRRKGVEFYSDNILLPIDYSYSFSSKSVVTFSVYFRVFNFYKTADPVLFENDSGIKTRFMDAVGLSAQYSFTLK